MENDNPQQDIGDEQEDSNAGNEFDFPKFFFILLLVALGIGVLYLIIEILIDVVPCAIVFGGLIFVLALPKN